MDKNTGYGLLLIALILIGFSWWNSKNVAEETEFRRQEQLKADSIARAAIIEQSLLDANRETTDNQPDSIKNLNEWNHNVNQIGESMAAALQGTQEFYTVENDVMRITFTNKGARIYSVELKDYKAYTTDKSVNKPLILFDGENNDFNIRFYTGREISTSNFYFTAEDVNTENIINKGDSVTIIPFRLYADSVSYVEFLYTIVEDSYRVGFDINMVNMNRHMEQRANSIDIEWVMNSRLQEKSFDNDNNNSTIAYKYPNKNSIEDIGTSSDSKSEKVPTRLEWINLKQHFFSTVLVTNGSTDNDLSYKTFVANNRDSLLKRYDIKLRMDFQSNLSSQTIPLEFYFLPNHFRTLKSYGHSFHKIIPLGGSILGIINRGVVIPVFNLLREHIASFGLIILILTVIIKLILSPLTWKSYISSAKMKVLKPEMDKINAKYPKQEDAMKKQQEVMALYKRSGVSMWGGCLPMLLQMPIFIALFRFFPSSIELRQQSFLWADDLSAYDSILDLPFTIPLYGNHVSLFCLLMAFTMYLSTKISMSQQPQNAQFKGMSTMMLYIMPIMMLLIFNNYSSGLSYYYFLSSLITIIQTLIIRKFFVNEEEILRKMNERVAKKSVVESKKPKKKSFFEKLEEKAREQQRLQQKQLQERNKKKKK